ncbi:MAG: FAD-dependent oxidoreductase [Acidimicrobiia bacterium]|nr:FAD-dependent oxidoreductase [Acidimicrobiia bacterium]
MVSRPPGRRRSPGRKHRAGRGSVPLSGEIVLSLRGLDHIDDVDELASLVHVGAGATLGRVREHVRRIGLDVAVDLSARDSATIGGLVATNAGGMHVLRYGPMRPGGRGRGCPDRRLDRAHHAGARQGQHGIRPPRPAHRQRRHPGGRDRGGVASDPRSSVPRGRPVGMRGSRDGPGSGATAPP